jgi:hypothetical protein
VACASGGSARADKISALPALIPSARQPQKKARWEWHSVKGSVAEGTAAGQRVPGARASVPAAVRKHARLRIVPAALAVSSLIFSCFRCSSDSHTRCVEATCCGLRRSARQKKARWEWHSVKGTRRRRNRRKPKSPRRAGLRARSSPQTRAAPNRPCRSRCFVPDVLVLAMFFRQPHPLRGSDLLRTQEVRAPKRGRA